MQLPIEVAILPSPIVSRRDAQFSGSVATASAEVLSRRASAARPIPPVVECIDFGEDKRTRGIG
jgi:hypothetical protein